MKIIARVGALLLASSVWAGSDGRGEMNETDFRIRDPFVLVDGGRYYLYESKPWFGGAGVSVRQSVDLVNWTARKPVMTVPADVPCTAVWAPEVHKFAGKYYLFATITEKKGARPIRAMSEDAREENLAPRGTWGFVADAPTGPFRPLKKGPIPPAELMTLDGTLYVENGKPYFVYCHEWCQTGNGTIARAPLSDDLSSFTAAPTTLLDARGTLKGAGNVTDGPFFHRSKKSNRLYFIWSNYLQGHGYCVLVRSSPSGALAGPWTKDEILYGKNGGHGMLFTGLDGKLRLSLHQPNNAPLERMRFFPLDDDGERLTLASIAESAGL